jgi:hypothetical protein
VIKIELQLIKLDFMLLFVIHKQLVKDFSLPLSLLSLPRG